MILNHLRSRTSRVLCAIPLVVGAASVAHAQGTATGDTARTDSAARRRIVVLPALGSTPETGLQFGVSALLVWQRAANSRTRPASLTASAIRSVKSQTRLRMDGEHWSTGNARRLSGMLQWQEFPLPYFGIGDDTPESAEETFVPRGTEANLMLQQRVRGAWYVTAGARYVNQRITSDSARALSRDGVTGNTGGTIAEFSGGVMTDTRDNLFAPRAGHWVQLSYARSTTALLSDFTYGTVRLDARDYRGLVGGSVIATQLQVIGVDGDAPFDQLALIGNSDIMRGYQRGRFRDRWAAAAQAEYRSPMWRRLGAVAFGGAGVSVPRLGAIGDARVLPTFGAGGRYQVDRQQRTGLRVDYGRGADGASGLYLGFNQAF